MEIPKPWPPEMVLSPHPPSIPPQVSLDSVRLREGVEVGPVDEGQNLFITNTIDSSAFSIQRIPTSSVETPVTGFSFACWEGYGAIPSEERHTVCLATKENGDGNDPSTKSKHDNANFQVEMNSDEVKWQEEDVNDGSPSQQLVMHNGLLEGGYDEAKDENCSTAGALRKNKRNGRIHMTPGCTKTDGKKWRCGRQTIEGYSRCEHHLREAKLYSMIWRYSMKNNNDNKKKKQVQTKASNDDDDDDDGGGGGGGGDDDHTITNKDNEMAVDLEAYSEWDKMISVVKQEGEGIVDGSAGYLNAFQNINTSSIDAGGSVRSKRKGRTRGTTQCTKTDGKKWRCRRPNLEGYSRCEYHLREAQMYGMIWRNSMKNKEKKKGRVMQDESNVVDCDDQTSKPEGKTVADLIQVKPEWDKISWLFEQGGNIEENESVGDHDEIRIIDYANAVGSPARKKGRNRVTIGCTKTDGKKWRCGKPTIEGSSRCEYHMSTAKLYSMIWKKNKKQQNETGERLLSA